MRSLTFILLFSSITLFAQDIGGDYYVATDGNDGDDGSYATPWATWDKAASTAVAGDTVYFLGGVYYENTVTIDNSGSLGNPICFFGYPSDTVILDGSQRGGFIDNSNIYNAGIYLTEKEFEMVAEMSAYL